MSTFNSSGPLWQTTLRRGVPAITELLLRIYVGWFPTSVESGRNRMPLTSHSLRILNWISISFDSVADMAMHIRFCSYISPWRAQRNGGNSAFWSVWPCRHVILSFRTEHRVHEAPFFCRIWVEGINFFAAGIQSIQSMSVKCRTFLLLLSFSLSLTVSLSLSLCLCLYVSVSLSPSLSVSLSLSPSVSVCLSDSLSLSTDLKHIKIKINACIPIAFTKCEKFSIALTVACRIVQNLTTWQSTTWIKRGHAVEIPNITLADDNCSFKNNV